MAHPDLDALLGSLLPFAERMLDRHGEFYPFGARMTAGGELELAAAETGAERPPVQELLDALSEGFRAQASAGAIRAAGVCYAVEIRRAEETRTTSAICVSLDHASAEAVDVFVPYRRRRFRGVKYGEPTAVRGSLRFFDAEEEEG